MEEMLFRLAEFSAQVMEAVVILLVLGGAVAALARVGMQAPKGFDALALRGVWLHFAAWILLALEFALGADIIRTIMAPSWDDIGKLGAIALIRTVLSVFLSRDLDEIRKSGEKV